MERLRMLKNLVYVVMFLFLLGLALLLMVIRPSGFYLWSGFAIIFISGLYMVRISLMALNELIKIEKQKELK